MLFQPLLFIPRGGSEEITLIVGNSEELDDFRRFHNVGVLSGLGLTELETVRGRAL